MSHLGRIVGGKPMHGSLRVYESSVGHLRPGSVRAPQVLIPEKSSQVRLITAGACNMMRRGPRDVIRIIHAFSDDDVLS